MANAVTVNQLIAKKTLAAIHNRLVFLRTVDRQLDAQWRQNVNGFKTGRSIEINRPARITTAAGKAINTIDLDETTVTMTLADSDQLNVAHVFSSQELTLEVVENSRRIGIPQGSQLATDLEKKIVGETLPKIAQTIVLSADLTAQDLLNAQAVLDSMATPIGDRSCLLPASAMADLAGDNLTLFTPTINDNQVYPKGYIKEFAGADCYSYNLLPVYPALGTNGTDAGDVGSNVANGATTIAVTGLLAGGSGSLPAGTVLQIAGRYFTNPETRESTGKLFQVTLASAATVTTGAATLTVTEAIYYTGVNQNVDSQITAADVITPLGSATVVYDQVFMYHMDAVSATVVPLVTSMKGAEASRADYDGISVRVMEQAAIGTDDSYTRFDVLGKGIVQRPEFAVRILVPRA